MFDFEKDDKLFTKPNLKTDNVFEYEKYKLQEYKGEIEIGKSGFHFCFSLDDVIYFKSFITNDEIFPLAAKFKPEKEWGVFTEHCLAKEVEAFDEVLRNKKYLKAVMTNKKCVYNCKRIG